MLLKTEQNLAQFDSSIINKLHKRLPQTTIPENKYQNLLSDLILQGTSSDYPEITLEKIAANKPKKAVQETLFKRLYNSWISVHQEAPCDTSYCDSIPKILVWGYWLRLTNQKSLQFHHLQFHQYTFQKLTAFWAAINFAEVESLQGMSCFGVQSPEAFAISCNGIAQSHLTSFEIKDFGGSRELTILMLQTFWQTIRSSKIEHLGVNSTPGVRDYWDDFCNTLKNSKIKTLSFKDNLLFSWLSVEQLNTFYEALSTINLEFLDLSNNTMWSNGSVNVYEIMAKLPVIGKIINLPSLKHLRWLGTEFDRTTPNIHLQLFELLKTSHLEQLEMSLTIRDYWHNDDPFPANSWFAFIDSLKELNKLKSLSIEHKFANEISSDILQTFCKMISESSIQFFSCNPLNNKLYIRPLSLSLDSPNWELLSNTFRGNAIKTFKLGCIELSGDNFTGFSQCILTAGIESLNLEGNNLENYSVEWWSDFATLIKQSKITSLNLKRNKLENMHPAAWNHFCDLIENSSIRNLHIELYKSYKDEVKLLNKEQIALFSKAIKNGSLETFEMDTQFGEVFWNMEREYIEQIFNAINRSKINKLIIHVSGYFTMSKPEIEKIALKSLRVVSNKTKTLFGLAANTLFGRCDAMLTDTGIIYNCNGKECNEELPENIIHEFKKFI